jgi:colanic acid/amylovoran biosynthesis glycosyltransferase
VPPVERYDATGRRPRVVCLAGAFPAASETFVTHKVLGLLRRGWDVHVVCWISDPDLVDGLSEPDRALLHGRVHVRRSTFLARGRDTLRGVSSVVADKRGRTWLRSAWMSGGASGVLQSLKPVNVAVHRLAPDVVHFEFGGLAVRSRRLEGLDGSSLVSFRGYDLNYLGLEDPHFYDAVWARADAVHVLGNDLARRLVARGCPDDLRRFVTPPGVDLEYFDGRRAARAPGEPLRVTTVARLHWKKGLEFALQAVRIAIDAGLAVRYRIAGAGPYEEAVRAAVRHLRLDDVVVELLGHVERDRVRSLWQETDVALQPSVSEGFCNAVLEAQAMRVPVVCTDADGLAENVVHGTTGLVVPRRDALAMADALRTLAEDPDRRRALGRAGRRRVAEHFSLSAHLDRFEAAYLELVPVGHPGPDRTR